MSKDFNSSPNSTSRSSPGKGAATKTPKTDNPKLKGFDTEISMAEVSISEIRRAKEEAKIKIDLRFQELQR